MLAQLLQAWKAQPVFISILGCDTGCAGSVILSRASAPSWQASHCPQQLTPGCVRFLSNVGKSGSKGMPADGKSHGSDNAKEHASLWTSLQRTLFPVSATSAPASPATSASRGSPLGKPVKGGLPHPTATAPGAATATAPHAGKRARERDPQRAARSKDDAFTQMSKPAERFSGTLLKGAVLFITIPLGVHMLSRGLLMSLCIRGLENERPETVAMTLKRIRTVIVSDFLAARFEAEDGVGLMMAAFNERADEAVLREFLRTAHHLLQFESSRDALLMSSLVERLERARAAGWIPTALRQEAEQLYLDAHAARRMAMEGGGPV